MDVLYSADLRGTVLADAVAEAVERAGTEPERLSTWGYAQQILEGIVAHESSINDELAKTSQSWPVERMPLVDRAILRIGVWELLHNPEIETAVAISEAVEIAGELSTEASPAFVHGVLATIAKEHRTP